MFSYLMRLKWTMVSLTEEGGEVEHTDTLLEEMTQITVSKIIAGSYSCFWR